MTAHEQDLFDDLLAERDILRKDQTRLMLMAENLRQENAALHAELDLTKAVEKARRIGSEIIEKLIK